MYKILEIEYSSPSNDCDPIRLQYKLHNTPPAIKWISKVEQCLQNYKIDDPCRFYGFDDVDTEKNRAITALNDCIDTINNYENNFIKRRLDNNIDQDTLNYLHNIFEIYHGLLDKPHTFYTNAPTEVKRALAQLNIEVHRCEAFVSDTGRKPLPRHIVTWFEMNRQSTFDLGDYEYFTDFYESGTIYILYVEIGKTLEDLALDNDTYIGADAYKPFRHYTADFVVKFYGSSVDSWKQNRLKVFQYYQNNKHFFESKGLTLSHPYNRPGNIPVAKLLTHRYSIDELRKRQMVTNVTLL